MLQLKKNNIFRKFVNVAFTDSVLSSYDLYDTIGAFKTSSDIIDLIKFIQKFLQLYNSS